MSNRYFPLFLFCGVIFMSILACGYQNALIINGYSMEPTFTDGQKLYTEEVNLSDLERGDIIYHTTPIEREQVKRLIGLPGEKVEIKGGIIYINDEILIEEYDATTPEYVWGPVVLKDNEYFVLGDNRNESADSHNYGPITGDQIIGRVIK